MSKNINIGDLINLEIKNSSKEELQNSFSDFHIDEVREDGISLRSFKVGDNKVIIKNNEVNIKVTSTLTEKDKEIHMNLSKETTPLVNDSFLPLDFFLSFFICLLSLVSLINIFTRTKKKIKLVNPEKRFLSKINDLNEDDFQFHLSFALREYIDSKYSLNFIQGSYTPFKLITDEDIVFLTSLDYHKFSGHKKIDISSAKSKALEIFKKLKEENNV